MSPSEEPSRVNILGVGISAVNMKQARNMIETWIEQSSPNYVCVTGVHGVMESRRDASIRNIHNNAGMVTPDGMPLVWLCRLYGQRHVSRVYGPDLMLDICEASIDKGYSHFFFGGREGVPELLRERLRRRFPGLAVTGCYAPPFRRQTVEEDRETVEIINHASPDIVWIGLSTPKQECWMAEHVGELNAPVLIGVGAAFDFLSGGLRQAPRWIQVIGMEWFFRLAMEPRRLWRRYVRNNLGFIFLIALQTLGLRRFRMD